LVRGRGGKHSHPPRFPPFGVHSVLIVTIKPIVFLSPLPAPLSTSGTFNNERTPRSSIIETFIHLNNNNNRKATGPESAQFIPS